MCRSTLFLIIFFLLAGRLLAEEPPPQTVSWDNIAKIFQERYLERSDSYGAKEAASLRRLSGGGFRFDPNLKGGWSKGETTAANDLKSNSISSSVSQDSPWGTSLEAHFYQDKSESPGSNNSTDQSQNKKYGVTLKQELLKNGLVHGLTPGETAQKKEEKELLEANMAFDQAFFEVIKALQTTQISLFNLKIAEKSASRAIEQHRAITSLVKSGYKAKADLLISESLVLRTGLRLDEAKRSFDQAKNQLYLKLFQKDDDPRLEISFTEFPSAVFSRLKAVKWPDDPPAVKKARISQEISALSLNLERRTSLPSLSLNYTVDKIATTSSVEDSSSGNEKTIGLNFSMPLVSGLSRDEVRISEIAAISSQNALLQSIKSNAYEKELLNKEIASATLALESAKRLFDLAVKNESLENQKYKDGNSKINDLRLAQDEVVEAEFSLNKAKDTLILTHLEFALNAGLLPQVFL